MRVTDFILHYLVSQGIDTVFGVTGGMIAPLFDAFAGRKDIRYVCTQHEQAAAMAADGYARFKGLGVAIATSGPGATNLITGIGCSYFDSIPVLCITGNVNTREARGSSGVRQHGFQETDIVSIVRPITKYARTVNKPRDIAYELNAAVWYAQEGRPGPVLLDIPIDILQTEVPDDLLHFCEPHIPHVDIGAPVAETVQLIVDSKRPVVIYGQGCRKAVLELIRFIEMTGIPCLPSWAALDLIPHDHPLFVSQFGVYGSRAGNFTVQNADLCIAIGTRLDTRMTGANFAPNAKKVVVDLDIHEAMKCKPDVMIIADAGEFLRAIIPIHGNVDAEEHIFFDRNKWATRIAAWKQKYPIVCTDSENIQPIAFIRQLNSLLPDDAIVVADCGANLSWTQQAFTVRGTQRLFSAYGYSPMGYSMAAAIGAYFATGQSIVVIIGDGGMQVNIQELQTLAYYKIPVKVFILNNKSYGIIKQFQEELYDGRYEATQASGGYDAPDFQRIASAYGIQCYRSLNTTTMGWMVAAVLSNPGPTICDVEIDQDARIFPKCTFGHSLENQSPELSPGEIMENMQNE